MFHADSPIPRTLLAILLVLCVATVPAAAVPPAPDSTPEDDSTQIVMTTVSGESFVDHTGGTAYVWAGTTADVNVTYQLQGTANDTRICLMPASRDSGTGTCQPATAGDGFERVTFSVDLPSEPAERTYRVSIVRDSADGADANQTTGTLAEATFNVTAIEKTADFDGDGLKNEREASLHTFVADTDTDNDGLQDGPEVHEYNTDPLTADTDGDGLRDAVEINRGTDPTMRDTDADGLTDGREMGLETDPTTADTDGDGIVDGREVEFGIDPARADTDGDGLDDNLETQLNTNPAGAWSPLGWGLLVFAGGLVVVGHRFGDWNQNPDTDAVTTGPTSPDSPSPPRQRPSPPRTDREEVLALLEEHDGKLRQSNIVDETDWSKAKVSRLLARLDDDGDITKIRLGRENVICLPGREPEGSKPRTER